MLTLAPSRAFLIRLSLISLVLIVPLFVFNYLKWTINTELMIYAAGMKAFSAQFWGGDIYPRWLMNTNAGLGSPMFLFYGPLPFYIGALLEPFATLDPNGYARVIACFIPAVFLSGITSYRWLSLYFSKDLAEKGAIIYAAFPYTILCIYASFGLAHTWALALLPFALEATHQLCEKGFPGLPKLAVAYALLALAHLPSTLVFAAIPVCYAFFMSAKDKRWKHGTLAVAAGLLGAALSAEYLLPAVMNRAFVTSEHFLDGQLVYSDNFYHIRFGLGLFLILLPMLGFFVELPKSMRWSHTQPVRFWLITCGVLLFMTTKLSLPIWNALPPLQHLQFPFRFFTAMLPGIVFIAISWIPHVKSKEFYSFFSFAALVIIGYFSYNDYFLVTDKYNRHVNEYNLIIASEYRTPWTEKAGLAKPNELPKSYTARPEIALASGHGTASMMSQSPRRIVLDADITSDKARIVLKRFYFPGWQASAGEIAEYEGLLALDLRKGKHTITLDQPWFSGEKEGVTISLIALIALLCLRYRSKQQENT